MSRLYRALFGGLVAGLFGLSGAASAAPGGLAADNFATGTPATLVGYRGGGGGSFHGFSGGGGSFHSYGGGGGSFHNFNSFHSGQGMSRGPMRYSGNWNHGGHGNWNHGGHYSHYRRGFVGFYGGYYPYYDGYYDDYGYGDDEGCYYSRRYRAMVCPEY